MLDTNGHFGHLQAVHLHRAVVGVLGGAEKHGRGALRARAWVGVLERGACVWGGGWAKLRGRVGGGGKGAGKGQNGRGVQHTHVAAPQVRGEVSARGEIVICLVRV